ncbi:MAG: transaldolase [Patescibacteria group bacterium]|nr:transaldolase [Patescibacteria group bacterium]
MRPENLKTRIFLDSGDPDETRQGLEALKFLDGQTTNPSLVAKNPAAAGKKFSAAEVLNFYESVVKEVSFYLPQGSVSVEVYADQDTPAEEMLEQGKQFASWISNAHIKFPTTQEGLKAAQQAVRDDLRVNMTLVFSQEQAAAVYAATKGAKKGDVFISPFVGRLDDIGQNGMDLIKNIVEMYKNGDGHVEVLTASVRSIGHITQAIALGSDILTAPLKVLKDWAAAGMPVKDQQQDVQPLALKPILYQQLDLNQPWQNFNIQHELTDKGLAKFAQDWNNLIEQA